jgi:hypothetical protein
LALAFGELVFEVEFLFLNKLESLLKLLVQLLVLEVPVVVDFLDLGLLFSHQRSHPALELINSRRQFVHVFLLVLAVLLKIGLERLHVFSLIF